MEQDTLLIHDLPPDAADGFLSCLGSGQVVSARQKAAVCKGCFGCWLQTPGRCVLRDGNETLGEQIARCERLVLITEGLYGGYSPWVKILVERSIPYLLPFFATRKGKMHHRPRYPRQVALHVCYYNAQGMTEAERALARQVVLANSVNLNAYHTEVLFTAGLPTPQEVLA